MVEQVPVRRKVRAKRTVIQEEQKTLQKDQKILDVPELFKAEMAAEEEKARRKAKEDAEWTETEFPPSAYQVFVAVVCDRSDKQGTLAMMDVGLLAATVSNAWRELTPEQEDDMKNWATQIRKNWQCEKNKWKRHPKRSFFKQFPS